jgi:hypothetical protein
MLHVGINWARSAGVQEVYANYHQTGKNKPCYDFFEKSGLACRDGNTFVWNAAQLYPLPSAIHLVHENGGKFAKKSAEKNSSELLASI